MVPINWDGPAAELLSRPDGSTWTSKRSRRAEIFTLLTSAEGTVPLVQRTCEVAAALLGASGAGICLIGGAHHQVAVHATDLLVHDLADLQADLGQGPCLEAVRGGVPVLVADLQRHPHTGWPVYAEQALDRGVRALFSFPITVGHLQVGSLDLYRDAPGAPTAAELADVAVVLDITTAAAGAHRSRHLFDTGRSLSGKSGTPSRSAPGSSRRPRVDLDVTVDQVRAAHRRAGHTTPEHHPDRERPSVA